MARRGSTTRRSKDEAPEDTQVTEPEAATSDVDNQEGIQNEAPATEENEAVTVTEPEVEQTETTDAPQAEPEQAPESTDASTDAAAASSEGEVKSKDDLEADFRSQCEVAVENSHESTGTVPEVDIAKVLDAYRALPSTASKSLVKNWLGEEMRQALMATDIRRARALSEINAKVQDASVRRSAAAPAKPSKSPTETYLDTLLTMELSKQFVAQPKDGELDENWQEVFHQRLADYLAENGPVAQYLGWLNAPEAERGEEPEVVDAVLKNAAKVAQGKAAGGRKSSGSRRSGGSSSGQRRNVGAHIEEFLAQADPNREYTIAEVANFNSTEYGDDHPSPGAVAARLTPPNGKPSTIEGFEVVPNSEPKKIRKI